MNVFKAYSTGLRRAIKLPRPVFLIYLVNLLVGIILVFPLYELMDSVMGNTKALSQILRNFDALIFSDFLSQTSSGIKVLFTQVKWMALIYWIVSIFIAGGLIRTLNQNKFTMTSFFSGASYNFFRFGAISTTMLIMQILTFALVFVPVGYAVDALHGSIKSEKVLLWIFAGATGLWLLLFIMLLMISDYAKFHAVLYNTGNFFKSVFGGIKYVFKNFFKTYLLYIMLLILPAILFYGYFRAEAEFGTHTAFGVLIVFLIQQVFIIMRIWFRVWIYSSPLKMYTADFLQKDEIKDKITTMIEWDEKAKKQLSEQANTTENSNLEINEKTLTEDEILKQVEEEEAENDLYSVKEIGDVKLEVEDTVKNKSKSKNSGNDELFELEG
jgi:hypothetical protein